jgi:hypothetical protein
MPTISDFRSAATLSLLLSLSPALAAAQSSWRGYVDSTRLRTSVDSFVVLVADREIGWQTLGWHHDPAGVRSRATLWGEDAQRVNTWVFADEVALQGVRQRSEIRFDASFVETGLRQQGLVGTQPMRIQLDRAGGQFIGSALTPSGGAQAVAVRTPVAADAIDDNAVTPLLPLIAWQAGLVVTLPVVSSGQGTVETHTASVVGARTVTVRAGTFEVWHVAISGGRYVLDADVTRSAPYRVVRFGPRGAPMSSQLVR